MTVSKFGIDCASSTLGKAEELKKAGVTFVCRYLSTPGNPKNLTKLEWWALRGKGLDVVLVFETTSHRALGGATSGHADAILASQQAAQLGLPGAPIYFAVDFDASTHDQALINAYLKAAGAAIGRDRIGVYGGYWVVKRSLDAKACKYAWQTYAWSGGAWDARAHLQQFANGKTLAGLSVDYNRALKRDFGQTPRPSIKRVVTKHLPGPAKKPAWFWAALKQFLADRRKA